MRVHLVPRAIALALCLSLAAPAAFADNGLPAPPAAPAPSSPPGSAAAAAAPPAPNVGEAALQARLDAAQQREQAALQVRLDAARRRMEVAAQQLAALSAQMYGPMAKRFQVLSGSPHALIGVQLERSSGTAGARVGEVSPGGPAQRAGIRSGDVIVAVNGTDVRGNDSTRRAIGLLRGVKPGEKVHLSVVRDAQTRDFTVTARPDWSGVFLARQFPDVPLPPLPPVAALPGFRAGFGAGFRGGPMIIRGPVADMELARLTPGLGRYFGTDSGVLVVRAPPDGALGLQDGDVILSIGGREPIDSSHVIRILASYDPGEKIALEVMRSHRKIALTTRMPADSAMSRRVLLMRRDALLGLGPVVRLRAGDRVL
jgi:membrane-associated protease RseP (regulator of RpoE activity)